MQQKYQKKKRGCRVKRRSAKAVQGGDDKQRPLTKAQHQSMERFGLSGAIKAATASTEEAATAIKHMNHSKDTKMQEAAKEWDEWDVDFLGAKPSKGDSAKRRRVSNNIFYKYVKDDKAERTMIGALVGPKPIISENTSQFLMEDAIHADCAN
jgi:hypothetical protein